MPYDASKLRHDLERAQQALDQAKQEEVCDSLVSSLEGLTSAAQEFLGIPHASREQ